MKVSRGVLFVALGLAFLAASKLNAGRTIEGGVVLTIGSQVHTTADCKVLKNGQLEEYPRGNRRGDLDDERTV